MIVRSFLVVCPAVADARDFDRRGIFVCVTDQDEFLSEFRKVTNRTGVIGNERMERYGILSRRS